MAPAGIPVAAGGALPPKTPWAAWALALAAPFLMLSPGILGHATADPPQAIFTGFAHLSTDLHQYASFIQQTAREGRLLTENRFSTDPEEGRFLFPYFVLLGLIVRGTGVGVPWVWHGAGYLLEVAFLACAAGFSRPFLQTRGERGFFLLALTYGGGLGFLPALLASFAGAPSSDLAWQRNITTFGAFWNPLSFAGYLPALMALRELCGRSRPAILGGLALLAWLDHPYTGMWLAATLVTWPIALAFVRRAGELSGRDAAVRAWGAWVGLAVVGAITLWQLSDPGYASTSQLFYTPVRLHGGAIVMGLGVLPLLAAFGLPRARQNPDLLALLAAWLTTALALTQVPGILAAKFQFALHLPLTLLAALGLPRLRSTSRVAAVAGCAVLFLSWPFVLGSAMNGLASDLHYLSRDQLDAVAALDRLPPGNVLTTLALGNQIAWQAREKNVYVGHMFVTRDWKRKAATVDAFFRAPDDGWRRAFLDREHIDYVYWPGALGPAKTIPGFQVVLANPGGTLYARAGR